MSGYYNHLEGSGQQHPQHMAMAYPDVGMMPVSSSTSSSSAPSESSSLSSSNTSLSSSPQAFVPYPGEAPPPASVSVVMPSPVRYGRQMSGSDMDMQPLDLSVRPPREEPILKRARHAQAMSHHAEAGKSTYGLSVGGRGGSASATRSGHRLSPYPMVGPTSSRSPNPIIQHHHQLQQPQQQHVRTDSPFYLQQRQTPSPAYYNGVNGNLSSYYMPLRPPSASESSPFQILASSNSVLNGLSSSNSSLFRPYGDHIDSAMLSDNNGASSTSSATLPRPPSQPQEEEEPTYMDLDSTSPTKTVYSRTNGEFRPGQNDSIAPGVGLCQKSSTGSGLNDGNKAVSTSPHGLDQRPEMGALQQHQHLCSQSFTSCNNQQLFCDSSDQSSDTSTSTTTSTTTVAMYGNHTDGGDPTTSQQQQHSPHLFQNAGSISRGQSLAGSPKSRMLEQQQSTHPSQKRGSHVRPHPSPSSTGVSHTFCPNTESSQHNHHPDSSSGSMSQHSTSTFSTLTSPAPSDHCPSSSAASSSTTTNTSDSGFTTSFMPEAYNKNPDISYPNSSKDAVTSSPNNKENRSKAAASKQRASFFVDNPSSFVEAKNRKNGEKNHRLALPDDSPSSQTKEGEQDDGENPTKISLLDFWISKVLMERVDAPSKPCKAAIQHKFVDGKKKIQVRLVDLIELQVEQSLKA